MKYILSIILVLSLSGCGEVFFIKPEYPTLTSPRKVPEIKGTFVRKGCMWINNHNTNLCGQDLRIVLTQFNKLRANENTCQLKIESYNEFIKKKKEQNDKYEIDQK